MLVVNLVSGVSNTPSSMRKAEQKLDGVLVAEVTKDTRIKDVSFTSNTQYPKGAVPECGVHRSA